MRNTNYDAVAQSYADGVKALFARTGAPTGERGGQRFGSYQDLAEQAGKLTSLSTALTAEAAVKLEARDSATSAQAAAQLLAKAATDIQVGIYLLEAAKDEDEEIDWPQEGGPEERSSAAGTATGELLDIIVGRSEPAAAGPERGGRVIPKNPADELLLTIGDVLSQISKRAKQTGEVALGGLLGLGLVEMGQLVGQLGFGLAQALGQAEKVTRLYNYFRSFIEQAYNSIISLLGANLAQAAGQRIVELIGENREAKVIGGLLDWAYQTKKTEELLAPLIRTSPKLVEQYKALTERLEAMDTEYASQIRLADKILRGLKWLGGIPVTILPQGTLVVALIYLALLSYVVLCGADYVDAPRLSILNRVPGVRDEVESYLA